MNLLSNFEAAQRSYDNEAPEHHEPTSLAKLIDSLIADRTKLADAMKSDPRVGDAVADIVGWFVDRLSWYADPKRQIATFTPMANELDASLREFAARELARSLHRSIP